MSGELQNQFFMQLNLNNLKIYISFVVIGKRCHSQNKELRPLTTNCIKNTRFQNLMESKNNADCLQKREITRMN